MTTQVLLFGFGSSELSNGESDTGGSLRIGLILNSPSPHQVDLLNALSGIAGVNFFVGYVFSHNPSRTWGAPTPDLPCVNLPTSFTGVVSGKLKRWFASQQADAWVLTSVYTSPATQYIAWLLRRSGATFAYLGEPPRPRTGLRQTVRQLLMMSVLSKADGIVGTGVEAARRYSEVVGEKTPVASVPYYIDVTSYRCQPLPEPPIEGKPVRFVASSQLIHRKGLDVLIDACRLLPKTGWTLEIYGSGPLEGELKAQAKATGRPIEFCGVLPYERRGEVFADKHCFVFPTRWDGWGMVVPEAMAFGLPTIATDQAMSAHDFVKNEKNGFLGPASDAGFLADSMQRILNNPKLISEFASSSRDATRDYKPEIGAETLLNFVKSLPSKRKST